MSSVFNKIINGEIPCYKIYEDELTISFLDIQPLKKGHTLVIPKKETDKFYDVDEKSYLQVHKNAQKIAKAIEKSTDCVRVGSAVIGLEVPHFHLHLVPINTMQDLSFTNPRLELTEKEFKEIQQEIISNL